MLKSVVVIVIVIITAPWSSILLNWPMRNKDLQNNIDSITTPSCGANLLSGLLQTWKHEPTRVLSICIAPFSPSKPLPASLEKFIGKCLFQGFWWLTSCLYLFFHNSFKNVELIRCFIFLDHPGFAWNQQVLAAPYLHGKTRLRQPSHLSFIVLGQVILFYDVCNSFTMDRSKGTLLTLHCQRCFIKPQR